MFLGFGFEQSHDVLQCADWGARHSQTLTIHRQIEITFPDGLTSGPWSMRRPRSDGNLLCSTPVSALMHPNPGTRPELPARSCGFLPLPLFSLSCSLAWMATSAWRCPK